MAELTGKLYSIQEVADRLRVDITTVRRWCNDGTLTEGADFFILPRSGDRKIYRFTQEQFDRITNTPAFPHMSEVLRVAFFPNAWQQFC